MNGYEECNEGKCAKQGIDESAMEFSRRPDAAPRVYDDFFESFFGHMPIEYRPRLGSTYPVPQTPRKTIEHTDDIADLMFILNDDHSKTFNYRQKTIKNRFKERHLALDLVDRIALMPLTIGIPTRNDTYERWQARIADYKADNPKEAGWVCLAAIVKELYVGLPELQVGLERFMQWYNEERIHSSLAYNVPKAVYTGKIVLPKENVLAIQR